MTSRVAGTVTASNVLPQTQNTAPVLEFRCLYTSDIRRKQKRWQDGRLKFHTFNKRIMVYDDRSNFVGDSHWREDHTFAEGEEVELERCGILVEVSACVGARDQDLTPLFSRVVKDGQERMPLRGSTSSPLRNSGASIRTQTVGLSLANPIDLRLAKRRKLDSSLSSKNGYARSLTGATLALSGTPSMRYDSFWLRTLKQPIERVDLTESGKTQGTPQEKLVVQSITQTKVGGSQAKRGPERSSPAYAGSRYARNIAGTALVLVKKTPATCGPLSAFAKCKMTTRTPIQEDEFIDIDVYDKEPPRDERVSDPSSQIIGPLKPRQAKHPQHLPSAQAGLEDGQHDKPFNPLRIKTRPKRNLLLIAKPPPLPPSFGCKLLVAQPIERRAETIDEDGQSRVKAHRPSSPVYNGINYNRFDAHLAGKCKGQTSMTGNQQQYVEAQTRNTDITRSVEIFPHLDWIENVGALLGNVSDPQLIPKSNLTGAWKQPLVAREPSDPEIKIGSAEIFNVSEPSPPPLVKASSQEVEANDHHCLTTTISTTEEDSRIIVSNHQANMDKFTKQDVIPLKPSSKSPGPETRGTKGKAPETVVLPMIASAESLTTIPHVQVPRRDKVVYRDQGPWSREAFDLFEWQPGPSLKGDSLKVG